MPTKQKSGLYRSKVKIGTAPDGSPIFKYISGRTIKELEAARQRVIAYYITGESQPSDELFGTYCLRWYHARVEPSIAPATRRMYITAMNSHVLPAFGDRNLRAIRSIEIQEFINSFSGKSSTMIAQIMTVLHGVFRSAMVDRIITQDPTLYIVKPHASKPAERRALTPDETAALLPLMDSTQPGLYLAVLYYLGLRPCEAGGLQWRDFDFSANLVHIQRDIDYTNYATVGELKTPAANRFVPIPEKLKSLLLPVLGAPSEFLFQNSSNRPYGVHQLSRMWLYLMLDAGLVTDVPGALATWDIQRRFKPVITPYYLRHNYITMCFQANINPLIIQKIVGHTNYSTTANIYTHVPTDSLTAALRIFD